MKSLLARLARRTPLAVSLASASLAATINACSSPSSATATDDGGASTGASSAPASGSPIAPASDDGGVTATGVGSSASPSAPSSDASVDSSAPSTGAAPIPAPAGWTLVWSDEFNGPNGSAVDSANWNQETGNSGWSNNQELEYYTPGQANAVVTDGSLVITATSQGASSYTCQYGVCKYTSARFNTQGKFEQAYGRFEARIQIPSGQGLWPAFWTLGNNIGTAGWPTCGEIDIMENVGKQPAVNHGSLHGPGYSGGSALTASITNDGGALADDFHVYDIEWEPNVVRFYMDGALYETRTPADVPAGDKWVYDHPFFVILNVAVGGLFPGNPNSTTTFPQTMKVDYVRVYKSDEADGG